MSVEVGVKSINHACPNPNKPAEMTAKGVLGC